MATAAQRAMKKFSGDKSTVWVDRDLLQAAREYGESRRPKARTGAVIDLFIRRGMKASGLKAVLDPQPPEPAQ